MIKCDTCPRCKDTYPGKTDYFGNHFCICGLTGNMVYKEPRREKRYNGKGYIHYKVSGCGLYETIEEALSDMTASEIDRWKAAQRQGNGTRRQSEIDGQLSLFGEYER